MTTTPRGQAIRTQFSRTLYRRRPPMTTIALAKLLDTSLINAKSWRRGVRYPCKLMRERMSKRLGIPMKKLTREFFAPTPTGTDPA